MALKEGERIITKKQAQNQNGYFTSEGKYLLSIWPRIYTSSACRENGHIIPCGPKI